MTRKASQKQKLIIFKEVLITSFHLKRLAHWLLRTHNICSGTHYLLPIPEHALLIPIRLSKASFKNRAVFLFLNLKFTVPVPSNSILVICHVSGGLKEFRIQGFPWKTRPKIFHWQTSLTQLGSLWLTQGQVRRMPHLTRFPLREQQIRLKSVADLKKTAPPVLKT